MSFLSTNAINDKRLFVLCVVLCLLLTVIIPSSTSKKPSSRDDEQSQMFDRFTSETMLPFKDAILKTLEAFQKPIVHQALEKIIPLQKQQRNDEVETDDRRLRMTDDDHDDVFESVDTTSVVVDTLAPRSRRINAEDGIVRVNPCDPTSLFVSFQNVTYYCRNETVTEEQYEILVIDPANNCSKMNTTEFDCMCPLDRTGSNCNWNRNFKCELELLSPERKCEGPPPEYAYGGIELDGEFPCFKFSMSDHVDFVYNMKCMFTAPPKIETDQKDFPRNATYTVYRPGGFTEEMTWTEIQDSFEYFLNHNYTEIVNGTEQVVGSFALTHALLEPLRFKIFNFNSLSDKQGWHDTKLNEVDYYIGQKKAVYGIKFANISEEHFAGDRLYVETRIPGVMNLEMPWEKLFIDFTDRSIPVYLNKRAIILASVIPVVSIGSLIALGVVSVLYLFKKRKDKLELKSN